MNASFFLRITILTACCACNQGIKPDSPPVLTTEQSSKKQPIVFASFSRIENPSIVFNPLLQTNPCMESFFFNPNELEVDVFQQDVDICGPFPMHHHQVNPVPDSSPWILQKTPKLFYWQHPLSSPTQQARLELIDAVGLPWPSTVTILNVSKKPSSILIQLTPNHELPSGKVFYLITTLLSHDGLIQEVWTQKIQVTSGFKGQYAWSPKPVTLKKTKSKKNSKRTKKAPPKRLKR